MSLRRYTWRSLRQRPGRALLTLLSIVIGVAATVSFAVTTSTTRDAYKNMFALVTGRAALEVSAAGDNRFAEEIAAAIAETPGVEVAVPTVRRLSTLFAHGKRANMQVLGIDPEGDPHVRDYRVTQGRMIAESPDMMLDASLARRLGIELDDEVKLLTERRLQSFTVVGLVEPQGATALRQAGLVFITLPRAQHVFRATGKVDVVQIVVTKGHDVDEVQRAIAAKLPSELEVRPPTTNSQLMKETLTGSEQGLRLASLFSLLLASFIILNTFLMNVSERRRQLAILRAVGATSGQIRQSILTESLLLGVIGTALGILAGLFVADAINRSLAEVLNVTMPTGELGWRPFLLAVTFGIGMSLAGAIVPAQRASSVSPLEGLDRVARSDLEGVSWKYLLFGLTLVVVSTVITVGSLVGWFPLILPTYFSVFLLLGIVMLSPLVLEPMARLCSWLLQPLMRIEGRLALKQVLRHRTRSTLTAGVLFVAASTGIGIAYSIMDNVDDVRKWYRKAFASDYFIRAMLPDMATGMAADLPRELGDEVPKIPHLRTLEFASMVEGRMGDVKLVVVAREFKNPDSLAFDLVEGEESDIRRRLSDGEVVIGSVLALRQKLKMGDDLQLETSEGPHKFRICGVANEYMVGGYSVYMQRSLAEQYLGVEGFDGILIRAEPEHRREVQEALQKLADEHGVLLHSFADVVVQIEFMISGIVGCLWGLIILGFIVGAFGVVNTLTMNVLEQTRELGLLRIVAMTRRQVRRTIVTQALIIAGVGLAPGMLGGLIVAWVMNYATQPTIGHAVEFGFRPWLLLAVLFGSLLITLVAAWFPARRATRLDVVQALHYE